MKFINTILLFLTIFNFIGCYDNKGNYDYKKINDIEIEFYPEVTTTQIVGDTLKVFPKFKYTSNDTSDLKLQYEWSYAGKTLSHERELSWIIDTTVRDYLVLRVTNIENNSTYIQSKEITPTSIYTGAPNYLVLSEKNGKSLLTYIRTRYKKDENGDNVKDEFGRTVLDNQVIEDVYFKENKEELGSHPLFLQEHISRVEQSQGHVIVFQEGGQGSVDLDGIYMTKDILLVESFSGKTYPEDFHPVNAEMMVYAHMIENYDGKIYSKIKDTYELFQSGYYIHTPLFFEEKEVRGSLINSQREQNKDFTLLLSRGTQEEPENRLLLIHDFQNSRNEIKISGKVVALPTPKEGWPENFIPLTDLGDSKVLHVGYVAIESNEAGYTMFLKKSDGTYQYQYFEIQREYSGEGLFYSTGRIPGADTNSEMLFSSPITSPIPLEECVFCTLASRQNKYVFIAHGKEIYFMDRDIPQNGIRHYYTCKANVVDMNARTYKGDQMIIGLDNGSVLLLNTNGAKQIESNAEKFLWESNSKINLGRIVDVTLKVGSSVS